MSEDEIRIGGKGGSRTREFSGGAGRKPPQETRRYRSASMLGAKQAMVKITNRKVHTTHKMVQANLSYLSRESKGGKEPLVPIELWDGRRIEAKPGASREAFEALAEHLGKDKAGRGSKNDRKSYPIMISFPPGTDREKAELIAREWGARAFGEKSAYAWVMHEDTEHPHAHFVVSAKGYDGKKLRINQPELKALRMLQAEVAGEFGIALTTSTRLERGESQAPKASRDRGEFERLARGEITPSFRRGIERAYKELKGLTEPDSWEARRLLEWRNTQAFNLEDAAAYRRLAEATPAKAPFYERFAAAHEKLAARKDAPPSVRDQYRELVAKTLEGRHAAPSDLAPQTDPLKPTAGMVALITVIAAERGLEPPPDFRDNFSAARGFLNDHAKRAITEKER